ncbi:MAG: RNA-splicing ligase RtcB [Thermus sp.]
MRVEPIAPYTYRIPKQGRMRVDAVFFASESILKDLEAEGYASLQQLMNVATLPGIVEPALAMPDIHWGYGFPVGGVAAFDPEAGGVVSPGGIGFDINCGVRLLASNLSREALEPHKSRLADLLYREVPSGVGSERKDVRFSRKELKEILREGAGWLVKRGFGNPEDLRFIESEGRLPWANPDKVSERAFERGAPQLGTLGSGNHFLEVQYVDQIYDPEAAEALGLFPGQVTVLIHTGSRGLGHQVCQDYVDRFLKVAPRYGIELVDKQLAAAPIQSPEGQDYLQAMAAAANFAFANRQLIAHFVREAFEKAGFPPKAHGLRVLYDLAHNNAKLEEHKGRRVLVHRKGATRAFGLHHPEIPPEYRKVGQPVLVPGDMGRYSFVLVGTEKAMEASFGSSCHGAGRKMSRHQAKKVARTRNLVRELESQGILVRAATRATVDEEMPEAYKDVSEVVRAVKGAGIGRIVARLRPLIVVKG